jgi:MYXO-CTERM domain-containing protein
MVSFACILDGAPRVNHMGSIATLAFVSFLFSEIPAFAGGEAPPVVNGDTTSDFEAVGALVACQGSNYCSHFCSGTLIDASWVLSAAHCVDALDDYVRGGFDVVFALGPNLNQVTDHEMVRDWAIHPEYSSSSNNIQHDIGLVQLDAPMDSVDPMPVNEDEVDWNWRNEDLTYVGYGVTSDNASDSGVKRYAEMPVVEYDDQFVYALDTADGQNLCSGDSGGAALEPVGDGLFELAAVNSFVFAYANGNSTCVGGGSGAARVDTHLDWIREYVWVGGVDSEEPGAEGGDTGLSFGGHDYAAEPWEDAFEGAEEPVGGCGCASSGAPAKLGWLALVVGGLLLPRRRR